MTIDASTSFRDLAFLVCTAMSRDGCTAVLCGGGAATIYAANAYQTRDLDFVLPFALFPVSAKPILDLGFGQTGSRGIYAHPHTPYTLEFLDGPLAVGERIISSWDTMRSGDLLLNIITPTDCVCDRLAAAIHWNDYSAISQAAAVARRQTFDRVAVENWCRAEGGARTFSIFTAMLESPNT